jgi:hypothetical protein
VGWLSVDGFEEDDEKAVSDWAGILSFLNRPAEATVQYYG